MRVLSLCSITLLTNCLFLLVGCGGSSSSSTPVASPMPDSSSTPSPTPIPITTPAPTPTPTPTATPLPASQILEAESANLFWNDSLGIPLDFLPQTYTDIGASGGQGIAWISAIGSGASFENVPQAESITVRYASTLTGEISVYVNGENRGNIRFESSGAWEIFYEEASLNVSINSGDELTLRIDPSDFAMNIDYVALNREPLDLPVLVEPEAIVDGRNKFEPEGERVIVFIGQDNEGVGGNSSLEDPVEVWNQGYLNFDLPMTAGVTSYVGLTDRSEDPEYNVPEGFTLAGLHNTFDFNAGPICLKCYLDNSDFDVGNLAVHLAIFFNDDPLHARRVANGENDTQIQELANFISSYPHVPFFIRPGFEFDVIYRSVGVSAQDYIGAFRRIVDGLSETGAENYVILYSGGYAATPSNLWHDYYPGEEYTDWVAYSHFEYGVPDADRGVFKFAENRDKPIMIAESTPYAADINEDNGQQIWDDFFANVFTTISAHPDRIKAYAYINTDWRTHSLWQTSDPLGFGSTDSRIQESSVLGANWVNELLDPKFVLSDDNLFDVINFIPSLSK